MENMNQPVEIGDICQLECINLGTQGDGIFKKDGFIVIVPGTEPGKTYDIKITKVCMKVAFGEIVE